jgi:hypothetical protein
MIAWKRRLLRERMRRLKVVHFPISVPVEMDWRWEMLTVDTTRLVALAARQRGSADGDAWDVAGHWE